jgi:hypothetical protein
MKVKELMEILNKLPGSCEVYFPDGEEVTGAEKTIGRLKEGYYSNFFTPYPKGKKEGIMFTHFEELSTGECLHCIKRN